MTGCKNKCRSLKSAERLGTQYGMSASPGKLTGKRSPWTPDHTDVSARLSA